MHRPILRTLERLDDLLEFAVFAAFRFLASRRGLMVLASVAAVVAMRGTPEPPSPAGPPAVSAQDLERELADLDLDDASVMGVQPVRFALECVTGAHGQHAAQVRFASRTYTARPGSLIPADGAPLFVVTRVDCNSIEAYDWMARQNVTAREEHRAGPGGPPALSLDFKVTAMAGDADDPVAVLSYRGESFVVQRGSRVPDCGDSAFEVLGLDHGSITIRDLWSGRKVRRELALFND